MDTDGDVVAIVDVIHITHAAVATVSEVCSFLRLYNAQLLLSSHLLILIFHEFYRIKVPIYAYNHNSAFSRDNQTLSSTHALMELQVFWGKHHFTFFLFFNLLLLFIFDK